MKICAKGHEWEGRRCNECYAEYRRAWNARNVERLRAQGRKDAKIKRCKDGYREKAAEYMEQWYEANREAEKAKALARYYKKKALGLVENSTPKVRAWKKANPERAKALQAKETARRRCLLHDANGSHTYAEWKKIVAKQKGICAACGVKCKLHKDHIVPLAMGGSDFAWNLQGLCPECNLRKGKQIAIGTQLGLYDKVPDNLKLAKR